MSPWASRWSATRRCFWASSCIFTAAVVFRLAACSIAALGGPVASSSRTLHPSLVFAWWWRKSSTGAAVSGPQRPGRTRREAERLPGGDGASVRTCLRDVGDAGEQPLQLGGGGQFTAAIEGGADGGGIGFGDDEHGGSMG